MHACMWTPELISLVFCDHPPSYVLRQGLSQSPGIQLVQPASLPQGFPVSISPELGFQWAHLPGHLRMAWDANPSLIITRLKCKKAACTRAISPAPLSKCAALCSRLLACVFREAFLSYVTSFPHCSAVLFSVSHRPTQRETPRPTHLSLFTAKTEHKENETQSTTLVDQEDQTDIVNHFTKVWQSKKEATVHHPRFSTLLCTTVLDKNSNVHGLSERKSIRDLTLALEMFESFQVTQMCLLGCCIHQNRQHLSALVMGPQVNMLLIGEGGKG